MHATIAEIATRAGVSITTVSRALNPSSHPVNGRTRQRVLEAARELDYYPSAAARALSMRRSWAIGILLPDIANPYYAEIVQGIEGIARLAGYTVIFSNSNRDPRRTREGLGHFRSQRVAGIVIAGGGETTPHAAPLAQTGIPTVVVGRHALGEPSVRVDNVKAGRLAAQHLVERGHHDILFISGPSQLTTVVDRLAGVTRVCSNAGLRLRVEAGDFRPASGYEATARQLTTDPSFTAICAANDHMAIGAMAACIDGHLAVPASVALMGFDDIPLARYLRPTLTTIAISAEELGVRAGDLLLRQIRQESVPAITWIEPRLMIRDSTATAQKVLMRRRA